MENNAFKVCETIEEGTKIEAEKISSGIEKETDVVIEDVAKTSDRTCCICCIFKKGSLQVVESSPEFPKENVLRGQVRSKFSDELRSFLNSVIYFVFVIVATFSISVMLFAELIIDAGAEDDTDGDYSSQWGVSPVIHWLSFAVLTLFFMEFIIRAITMRLALLRDFVSLLDGVACVIAFISNLCITLVLGTRTPLDAISLVILLRLLRIWSLVDIKSKMVRKVAAVSLQEKEEKLMSAESTISCLRRQIMDKDFHIKQLQAHLGDTDINDPQLKAVLRQTGLEPSEDGDLKKAIALSKKTYDEEHVFGSKSMQEPFAMSNLDEGLADNCIIVHPRPRREEVLPITPNLLEEYFPKPSGEVTYPMRTSPGAIRKIKNPTNAAVVNSTADQYIGPILESLDDNAVKGPITICIDPNILKCEEDRTCNSQSEASIQNSPGVQPRVTTSQPSSGPGSSDECSMEAESSSTPKSVHKLLPSMLNKHSGSSLGSESGYQSEDLGHNSGKFSILNSSATDGNGGQEQSNLEFVQLDAL